VTGSAGKTTTRRAIAALVAAAGVGVHATSHNFNNLIGVPLTLLGLGPQHQVAVIEIGTNQRGEIAAGVAIAEPDVGVLTLVADAHGEGLGSAWDIALEKGDLLAALPPSGVAIANGDDPRSAAQLLRSPASTWVRYGEDPGCDVALVARELRGVAGQRITTRVLGLSSVVRPLLELDLALLGRAGVSAALAAIAAADAVLPAGAPDGDVACRALGGDAVREEGRMMPLLRADGAVILDDAYNANPASTLASIEAAREIAKAEGRQLVLVLGEMYELGAAAEALHETVGRAAALARPRAIVAVKGLASRYLDAARRYGVPCDLVAGAPEALAAAQRVVQPGDLVLIKASNGVGLSPVARALGGAA
jgi:UDP-N-acetylmuramoyl-tripeptide--D-alanyl-D-alanine ligase